MAVGRVGIGALAVAVLTVDYGRLPYIALMLAASFGSYSLIKKRLVAAAGRGPVRRVGRAGACPRWRT